MSWWVLGPLLGLTLLVLLAFIATIILGWLHHLGSSLEEGPNAGRDAPRGPRFVLH